MVITEQSAIAGQMDICTRQSLACRMKTTAIPGPNLGFVSRTLFKTEHRGKIVSIGHGQQLRLIGQLPKFISIPVLPLGVGRVDVMFRAMQQARYTKTRSLRS